MKLKRRRLDNQGNTLILVMVVITFLMILGSLLMTMTATNLRLKYYDRETKNNFYETESGMAELRTGLNELAAEAMKDAYEQVFDNYVTVNGGSEGLTSTFDKIYLNNLMKLLTNKAYDGVHYTPSDPKGYEYSVDVLQSYLNPGTDDGAGNSIRTNFVSLNPAGENYIEFPWAAGEYKTDVEHYILLKNVTMRCKDQAGYMNTITTDIRMDCPAVFFASSGIYPEYTQYALIADDTLVFDGAADTSGYTIKGNLYAGAGKSFSTASNIDSAYPEYAYRYFGNGGIQFLRGTGNVGGCTLKSDTIITRGNVAIENNASVDIKGNAGSNSTLWAENIETIFSSVSNGHSPSPAKLKMDASVYVSDDMQLNAHNSNITLSGTYNGFSYNRNETLAESNADAKYSSAILVNGQDSTLDFSHVSDLSLAGHAFISRKLAEGGTVAADDSGTAGSDILTGEVLTLKSNQVAYMVADEYMVLGHNPVLKTELEGMSVGTNVVDTNMIRNSDPTLYNLLSCSVATSTAVETAGDGYTAFYYNSGDDGMVPVVYYYYEFKSQEAANQYFQSYVTPAASGGMGYEGKLSNLAEQFIMNIDNRIKINASLALSATKYGNISYYDGGIKVEPATTAITNSALSGLTETAREYYSRQLSLIANYELAESNIRFEDPYNQSEDKGQKRLYDVLINRANVINDSAAPTADWGFVSNAKEVEIPDRNAKVYVYNNYDSTGSGTPVKISSLSVKSGIVVATGDVEVDDSFTGLIIAGGVITVKPNGHVTADKRLVQYILKFIVSTEKAAPDGSEWKTTKCLSRYFNEYEAKDSMNAVDVIDVSNYTNYENWAKNKED